MSRYKCPRCGGSNSYGGDPYPCLDCGYDGRVGRHADPGDGPTCRHCGVPVVPCLTCESMDGFAGWLHVFGEPDDWSHYCDVAGSNVYAEVGS